MHCKHVIMSMLSEILYRIHNRGVYYQGAYLTHCFEVRGPDIGNVYIIIPVPSESVSRGPRFHVRENDIYAPAYTHARYRCVV